MAAKTFKARGALFPSRENLLRPSLALSLSFLMKTATITWAWTATVFFCRGGFSSSPTTTIITNPFFFLSFIYRSFPQITVPKPTCQI